MMKFDEKKNLTSPSVFPNITKENEGTSGVPLGSGKITSLLGNGGMANVYEIWNPDLEVYRAVKLIHPTSTPTEIERFDTEMKITAKLHHPYIVEIHGVGKWNNLSYIEMEKIDGVTVKQLIQDRGALPEVVCTSIGIMIGMALQYAHDHDYILYGKKYHGIIHRDIKPNNIMLCKTGIAKLMDFGIARPSDASFHTIDGSFVGTIHYLPPELLQGDIVDVRTDMYSLGVSFYEIITGQKAFSEPNMAKLMVDKTKNNFKPLSTFSINVSNDLKNIIARCMHQNYNKRIHSARELVEKLQKIHKSLTSQKPEEIIQWIVNARSFGRVELPTRSQTKGKKWFFILSLCFICISITAYVIVFSKRQTRKQEKKIDSSLNDSIHSTDIPPVPQIDRDINDSRNRKKINLENSKQKRIHNPSLTEKNQSSTQKHWVIKDSLMNLYQTDNLVDCIAKAGRSHKHSDVLTLYAELTDKEKKETNILIYVMRAYEALKNNKRLQDFMAQEVIEDAEYYLLKAKLAYKNKNITESVRFLDLSLQSSSLLLDESIIKQDVYYIKALCASQVFNNDPTEQHYKNALGEWHRLKLLMRNENNHRYYMRAIEEMQHIGMKFRKNQGVK